MTKSEPITALAIHQPNLQKDDVEAAVNCTQTDIDIAIDEAKQ